MAGIGKPGFFTIGEPGNLSWTVFDAEEKENGERESWYGLKNEELLPAMQAEEGGIQQYTGERCADNRREQKRGQHERGGAGALIRCEPLREKYGIDDRIETGF